MCFNIATVNLWISFALLNFSNSFISPHIASANQCEIQHCQAYCVIVCVCVCEYCLSMAMMGFQTEVQLSHET